MSTSDSGSVFTPGTRVRITRKPFPLATPFPGSTGTVIAVCGNHDEPFPVEVELARGGHLSYRFDELEPLP